MHIVLALVLCVVTRMVIGAPTGEWHDVPKLRERTLTVSQTMVSLHAEVLILLCYFGLSDSVTEPEFQLWTW